MKTALVNVRVFNGRQLVPDSTVGLPAAPTFASACVPAIAPGSLHSHFPGVGEAGLIWGPEEAQRFVAAAPPGADYANASASVAALHAAGVPILAGTDANSSTVLPANVPYGAGLHSELELLAAAGLATADLLRAATVLPAI